MARTLKLSARPSAPSPVVADFIEANLKDRIEYRSADKIGVICPLHDDNHASMVMRLDNGVWWCYACGNTGNIHSLRKHLKLGTKVLARLPRPKNREKKRRGRVLEDPCCINGRSA